MKLMALMGLLLIAVAPALAIETAGVFFTGESGGQGVGEDARETLVDSWNDTQTPLDGWSYAAEHFGFPYTPSTSYTLSRVEWYAGGIGGTVTVSILADSGSGLPDGAVLASATYVESEVSGWQGSNLDTPVALTGGTLYYIVYDIVPDATLSHATAGTVISHYWFYDANGYWEGPSALFYWMARFYGDIPTASGNISWSEVKGSY
ncbi:DUF4082 domain-containing protein [bacterium]|nr:DUF4082 domain-containing protein [bacterium]